MLHVAQTCVFDPTRGSEPLSYGRVRQLIADRLDLLAPFRKQLVPSPLGFGQPAWIEDSDVDLDAHLHEVHLPQPGGVRQLAEFSESFISRPVTPTAGVILAWLASATGILHRPRPLVNVVVSTCPGPPFPPYCAGAPLVAPYPIGPIIDGAAINITAQTYLDALHIGVVTSARDGPDPWEFATGLTDALGELTKVAT